MCVCRSAPFQPTHILPSRTCQNSGATLPILICSRNCCLGGSPSILSNLEFLVCWIIHSQFQYLEVCYHQVCAANERMTFHFPASKCLFSNISNRSCSEEILAVSVQAKAWEKMLTDSRSNRNNLRRFSEVFFSNFPGELFRLFFSNFSHSSDHIRACSRISLQEFWSASIWRVRS